MRALRHVNIKTRPYLFLNSMINIRNFNPNLLSIDQLSFNKNTDCVIYDIEYIKNLDSENFIYLVFNYVDAYIEKNNEDKHLIVASTDKNKEAFRMKLKIKLS